MLTPSEIRLLQEHLERAQNPLFFFDNDPDGLCSFLLLRRFLGRGKGVAIKSFPTLDESYVRKVDELHSDYVFILDKPLVSDGFFSLLHERNIPVVWIDHHDVSEVVPPEVCYVNPCRLRKSCVPVTALCYQLAGKKEDLWLAVVGAVADGFLPPYYDAFLKSFPEWGIVTTDPFEVLYSSRIGELALLLNNGLKDTTTNVVRMTKFLCGVRTPAEVMEEHAQNYSLHRRSQFLASKYERILEKAKRAAKASSSLVFFRYSGDISVSGELANQLKYLFPAKYICVAYVRGAKANLSLRGSGIRDIFLKALDGFSGASGGGHADAVGGQMQSSDLDSLKERLETFLA